MVLQNFIVFEGIDGAGTTTQLNLLRERADTKNFLFTAEPTSAATGKFLRQMLKGDIPLQPVTAAYLFAADRNEHIFGASAISEDRTLVTGVQKSCADNHIVVSDRYFFSSLAYQSVDCGSDIPRLLNSCFPLPALLFYFDIDPSLSIKRIALRGEKTEIYEKLDFLSKTTERYKKIIASYNGTPAGETMRVVTIDASLPKEEIAQIIWKEIQNLPIFKA